MRAWRFRGKARLGCCAPVNEQHLSSHAAWRIPCVRRETHSGLFHWVAVSLRFSPYLLSLIYEPVTRLVVVATASGFETEDLYLWLAPFWLSEFPSFAALALAADLPRLWWLISWRSANARHGSLGDALGTGRRRLLFFALIHQEVKPFAVCSEQKTNRQNGRDSLRS